MVKLPGFWRRSRPSTPHCSGCEPTGLLPSAPTLLLPRATLYTDLDSDTQTLQDLPQSPASAGSGRSSIKKGTSDPVPSFFYANGASPQGLRRVRADQSQHWLDSDNGEVVRRQPRTLTDNLYAVRTNAVLGGCCFYKLHNQREIDATWFSSFKFAALLSIPLSNCFQISPAILFSIAAPTKNVSGE